MGTQGRTAQHKERVMRTRESEEKEGCAVHNTKHQDLAVWSTGSTMSASPCRAAKWFLLQRVQFSCVQSSITMRSDYSSPAMSHIPSNLLWPLQIFCLPSASLHGEVLKRDDLLKARALLEVIWAFVLVLSVWCCQTTCTAATENLSSWGASVFTPGHLRRSLLASLMCVSLSHVTTNF